MANRFKKIKSASKLEKTAAAARLELYTKMRSLSVNESLFMQDMFLYERSLIDQDEEDRLLEIQSRQSFPWLRKLQLVG